MLVFLSIALRDVALPPLQKFLVVGLAASAGAFAVSAILRRVPPVGRVI